MKDIDYETANPFKKETEVFTGNFELLDYAREYLNNPSEDSFRRFKQELDKSSGLSTSYVLGFLNSYKKNCEQLQELIIEKYDFSESEVDVYDPLLGDFVSKSGESKKSKL